MLLNLRIYEQPRIRLIIAEERERKMDVRVTMWDFASSICNKESTAL